MTLHIEVRTYMMGLRYETTLYDDKNQPVSMGHGDTQARAVAMALRELADVLGQ